jgi:dienelactone hydrolase
MRTREIAIDEGGPKLVGLLMSEPDAGARPLVLMFPSFLGRSDADLEFGQRLIDAGYHALACDLYGDGRSGSTREECSALMKPLLADRAELRRRLVGWLDAAAALPEAAAGRIAAIGFCFGGLCALDLARSGRELVGVASFHGLLSPPDLPPVPIRARIIVFHGWDDPTAPPEQVTALGRELSVAGADWQIHAYGGTMHSFTNRAAAAPERGSMYNALAAERSWTSLLAFLGEVLA